MGRGLKGPWLRYLPNPPALGERGQPELRLLSRPRPAGGAAALPPPPAQLPTPRDSPVCSQDPLPSLASFVDAEHFRSQDAPEQPGLLTSSPRRAKRPWLVVVLTAPPPLPPQLLLKSGFAPGGGFGVIANTPFLQFSKQFRLSNSVIFISILKSFSPSCCSECKSCNKRGVNSLTSDAAMCSLHGRWLFEAPILLILSETDCTEALSYHNKPFLKTGDGVSVHL